MINLTSFYQFLLAYVTALNIFSILPTTVNKIAYYIFFLITSLICLVNFKKIKIPVSNSSLILIFYLFFQLLRVDIPYYILHLIYISLFSFQILFLLLANNSFIITSKLIRFLEAAGYITTITALIHLLLGLYKPGWNWPVNIALQEITLIGIIYSLWILSGNLRKFLPLISLFLLLVILRDSGKATFLALIIGLLSIYKYPKKQIRIFLLIFIGQFIFLSIAWTSFEIINSLEESSVIRYFLIKRFGLILDGITFLLSSPSNLLLGSGFDTENYFKAGTFIYAYKNAPQLFILTTSVFGGILFPLILITNLVNFIKHKKSNLNTKKFTILMGFFISLAIINSFHEYFNNPFVFFTISLVIISFNSISENGTTYFHNNTRV